MVTPRRPELVATLRQRFLRALQVGALAPGDRLPSTRALADELRADPRVVADAYRVLAAEGLVTLRPRSGAYLLAPAAAPARAVASPAWLAEVLVAGITRGVPAPALPRLIRRALGGPDVRVAVVATTVDQTVGICRELATWLGVQAEPVLAEALPAPVGAGPPAGAPGDAAGGRLPPTVRRAAVLVTTEAHAARVAAIGAAFGRPCVAVAVRPELYDAEWALLGRRDAWLLVADARFGAYARAYLRARGAPVRVHVVVVGRDDPASIPPDAPVYATQAARERLDPRRLPPGLLPPARTLADGSLAEVLRCVLAAASAG